MPPDQPWAGAPLFLVVDDDVDSHFFLKRDLQREGITATIDSVFGGEEAVRYLAQCLAGAKPLPMLVFLDIRMPGLDGFGVLAWVRDHDLLGKLTLTMFSSSDDPDDVKRAMALGAHTYLNKPTRADHLRDVVTSAIRLNLPAAARNSNERRST
jgi:CheY-like chemotaxis protein